jgi:AcrR family transcriptional regulator
MSQAPVASVKRKPGRPPSEAARRKVLDTAYRIVMKEGLGRLTIERVAAEAGVSKPTIYRSWTNAQELAMAAFMAQPQAEASRPRTSSARRALLAHLSSVIDAFATQRGRQITLTMASADPQSELAKAFRNQIILKGRATGAALIGQAIASGDIRRNTRVDAALDMLYGPLFFRLLAGHLPLSAQFAGELVDTLFDGVASSAAPAAAPARPRAR